MNRLIKHKYFDYGIVVMISAFLFVVIYGVYVIVPTYTSWIVEGDLRQHYIGWEAYRNSDWHFPIGMIDSLVYPNQTSVIYTDSIPLFAIFFKILSPILPNNFQYFGIWALCCYILHGIFSLKILKRFTDYKLALLCGVLFSLLMPTLAWRLFGHEALGGQWIILLASEPLFDTTLEYQQNNWEKKLCVRAFIVGILASSIHMYFVLMCGIIELGICLKELLIVKKMRPVFGILLIYISVSAIIVYLFGGFSAFGSSSETEGLGYYSMNFNALFNSMGVCRLTQSLPLFTDGQYEGFGYIGFGGILLLLFNIVEVISYVNKKIIKDNYKIIIPFLFVFFVALIVAASPIGSCGDNKLYTLVVPEFIAKLWGTFRASGRMVMIIVHLVILISIILLGKLVSKRCWSTILVVSLLLQIYDVYPLLENKNITYNLKMEDKNALNSISVLDAIGDNKKIEHIMMTYFETEDNYMFTQWALDNDMTINAFPVAHATQEELLESVIPHLENPKDDEIFIFKQNDIMRYIDFGLHFYNASDYVIGYINKLQGFDEIKENDLMSKVRTFGDNIYMENCEDIDGIRHIYPGGYSYGPYWYVKRGEYQVTIEGKGLENVGFDLYSSGGEVKHKFEVISCTTDQVKLMINLEENISNFEIMIVNNSMDRIVQLSMIQLCPIVK